MPQAGRHSDSDHPAGVPLGPVHLRHRERAERVHGEAGHGGRPDHAARCSSWPRTATRQEPEGRRGTDVPSQPGAAGSWHKRIHDGEIGDIILMRGYRMHGPVRVMRSRPSGPASPSELLWQVRHFHAFLWASGGCFSDFYIHHHRSSVLDEERLAGQGPGPRRTALQAEPRGRALRGSELRHVFGGIHLCRRRQDDTWTAAA